MATEQMAPDKTVRKKGFSKRVIIWILIFSLSYTIIRYHIAGSVPWQQLPFFIMNKAVSLNGIILLIFTFAIGPLNNLGVKMSENWLRAKKPLGIAGFIFIFVHIIMSFMLFSPAYYGKFFGENGTLTLNAGLSMLMGTLAFIVLWFYNLNFYNLEKNQDIIRTIKSRGFLLLVMPLTALHLFFMGYKGWLNPAGWNGGIPPISLIAFIFFTLGYVINILGRK